MTRVCDIRALDSLASLHTWASTHRARVAYLGPDLQGFAVYAATHGHVTRVATSEEPDPRPLPIVWRSPLEPR